MSDKIFIRGGAPISGDIIVAGSKNASLPLLAASLLFEGPVTLKGLPEVSDVAVFLKILDGLGFSKNVVDGATILDQKSSLGGIVVDECASEIRASILVAGSLLSRFKKCSVPLPGGCSIGARPIDLHLKAFKALGATVELSNGRAILSTKGLVGGEIVFPFPSVGATENAILASVYALGTTTIVNAACEPEVVALCRFLQGSGVEISGVGSPILEIRGCSDPLQSGSTTIIPDRIEALSYVALCAANRGSIALHNCNIDHMRSEVYVLRQAGVEVELRDNAVFIDAQAFDSLGTMITGVYPGFSTDVQSLFLAAGLSSNAPYIIEETIFENRFMIVPELEKTGAKIQISGRQALITPQKVYVPSTMHSTDLRAAMALIIHASTINGKSEITGIGHLLRGYESPVEKLRALGVDVN